MALRFDYDPLGSKSLGLTPALAGGIAVFGLTWVVVSNVLVPIWVNDVNLLVAVNTLLMGVAMLGTYLVMRWTSRRYLSQIIAAEKEVHESHRELLQRLVRVAQLRDGDTGAHISRMAMVCQAVALAMGWSEEDADMLMIASQLHDIGKVGIPDSILLKEGPLTPEERAHMQTHVQIGARILSGGKTRMVQMAERIAVTHHEQWSGNGYPMGLKGEAIPLEGRIAALCDVFDALVSKRPYKEAWRFEDAVAEIQKQSGRHFDPEVVDGFLRALPAIRAIVDDFTPETGSMLRRVA